MKITTTERTSYLLAIAWLGVCSQCPNGQKRRLRTIFTPGAKKCSAPTEIDGFKISEIAAKDAVLLLWCTSANLVRALAVMRAWDFTYKSHFIWDKESIGTGYWFRNQDEVLLLGTGGNLPLPMEIFPSILRHPKGKHSGKPPVVREIIEAMFPHFDPHSRIELFYRGEQIPGWSCWGNEALSVEAA